MKGKLEQFLTYLDERNKETEKRKRQKSEKKRFVIYSSFKNLANVHYNVMFINNEQVDLLNK